MPRRGTTTQRGYGATHRGLRAWWATRVNRGTIICPRCNTRIHPNQKWDLGHHDTNRTRYTGPEHATCNRKAGAQQQTGRTQQPPQPPLPGEAIEASRW